jgi:hypothetical protein
MCQRTCPGCRQEPEDLSLADLEAGTAHGLDRAALAPEALAQVAR